MNVRKGGRKKRTRERKGGKKAGRENKEECPVLLALAVLPGCTSKLTKHLVPGTGPGWVERDSGNKTGRDRQLSDAPKAASERGPS